MTGNNNDDKESFAEWLFFARKQRHRRRTAHTTNTTNKETEK